MNTMESTNGGAGEGGEGGAGRELNPVTVCAMVGGKGRWPMLRLLADGRPRTATEVARALGRDFDGVSKHLRLLRAKGLLEDRAGEDRRYLFFHLPERFRRTPGWLNFGGCRVRLDGGA